MPNPIHDLLPCPNPWCDSKLRWAHQYPQSCYAVACGCGFMGPLKGSSEDAITAWNTRTQPSPREEGETSPVLTKDQIAAIREVASSVPVHGVEEPSDVSVSIRIAIWNAARDAGMAQDRAIALVNRAMAETCMAKALALLTPAPTQGGPQ